MVVLQPVMILFVAVSIIALHSFLLSYVLFPLSTIMEPRFGQEAKAPIPILVTEDGMMTEVILLHPAKQSFPMLVVEFGIVMEFSPSQLQKALSPMLVIELGIVTELMSL